MKRRRDRLLGSALFSGPGAWFNQHQKYAHLAYFPDSIRKFAALPELSQLADWWTHQNRRNNIGDLSRLIFLVQNSRQVLSEGVPGDFAEVGVYKGNSSRVLKDALERDASGSRRLYLFDTFGGFDTRDLSGVDAEVPAQFADVSLAGVQAFVGTDSICEYRPGYFPESAEGVETSFALVHLDCDLYEPMLAGLQFFYPRLSTGGLAILHDYSSREWPGATKAVDEFMADKPERLVLMPDKSGTAVFRKT